MINVEKIKQEKCQTPTPLFKNTCPCTIFLPPFLIFQIPLSPGGNQNLLSPPLKKGGGGVRAMVGITLVDILQNWLNWFHFLSLEGALFIILIDCIIFLSTFRHDTRMSLSTVSLLAQLDSGILYLYNVFL